MPADIAVRRLLSVGVLPDVRWNSTHTTCIIFTANSYFSCNKLIMKKGSPKGVQT